MSDRKKAFILMPFQQPFDSYYQLIFKPALEMADYDAYRADDLFTPRPIVLDIQDSIAEAELILCEMSERNSNVFYELGLAHAIGKPAVLVSRTETDIPFDLRHLRVIIYDTQSAGWEDRLRGQITKAALSINMSTELWPPPLVARNANLLSPKSASGVNKQDSRILERPINLGFDGPMQADKPLGWFDSYGYVRDVSTTYKTRVVRRPETDSVGSCVIFENDHAKDEEFGSLMQRCNANFLAGRTIRFEGEIRAEEVKGWAGLWLRADGTERSSLFFDNMYRRPIRGSTSWKNYRIDAPLPIETSWLNYGIVLAGCGRLWADNFRLLMWNKEGSWEEL